MQTAQTQQTKKMLFKLLFKWTLNRPRKLKHWLFFFFFFFFLFFLFLFFSLFFSLIANPWPLPMQKVHSTQSSERLKWCSTADQSNESKKRFREYISYFCTKRYEGRRHVSKKRWLLEGRELSSHFWNIARGVLGTRQVLGMDRRASNSFPEVTRHASLPQ